MDEDHDIGQRAVDHLRLSGRRYWAWCIVALYAWWATGLEPFSVAGFAAVEGAGVVAVIAGTRAHQMRPAMARRGALLWALLLTALVAWELAAYLQHPRADHPTLSSLADNVLDPHPVRAAAFLLWLAGARQIAR